jgi:glycosyltransferase involved in cell wall biosynthesis
MSNRLIVTIHDLIHFKFPDFFGPGIKIRTGEYFLKTIREKSLKVFCVSDNTKSDLMEMFGYKDEQITVIYNGLNNLFFNLKKEISPLNSPYILYTGNIKPHKNVSALIEAFRLIKPFFSNLKLVLAGAGKKIPEEFIHDDIKDDLVTTGYLPRKKLINYIDNAEIFVFPSFYEGFGFPPLEAMARGKAVISSPSGSLKEILGKAPVYFDPYSPQELSEKIILLLKNKKLRKETEEKGLKRAKLFTAEKSVSLYLKELKKLSD